jgi:FixJ family two-component response regulator
MVALPKLCLASIEKAGLSQTPVIAIVEHDISVREAMRGLLRAVGYATEGFASAEDFLQSEWLDEAACLITDLHLGGMSGLELRERLRVLDPRLPVIVISAFSDERERALTAGAICFLGKPVAKGDLLRCILAALAGALDCRNGASTSTNV